ncbi:MAG: exodeoxyribonuclease VII large subunit [Gammaproteobacteria bacterium RIFCSPHIGHO2_12_FULL_35_23]|nr:MAG: exodeoxyribonuclease VII large subunit [Gammaproteobacteria bacterium RIFCSPHIGHO2_12_FULL_35_23]
MIETNQDKLILSVTQLNQQVHYLLEQSFPYIFVKGEVSNLSCPTSGHWYFSLKDEAAQVRCAMFRLKNRSAKCRLTDGMQIIAAARVSLYEPRGDYQLIVEQVEEFGLGLLQKKFEELKQRLEKAGLFNAEHKKSLPIIPNRIGIITSPTGAAIRDILHVLKRRMPAIPVLIYPTLVQGELAAKQIATQIHLANQRAECDLLILARGGGSLEDLWPFNEEIVAQAIFASLIPIITGIGHEIDFTIADFVADQRTPTPSAAAELASPNQQDLLHKIMLFEMRLIKQFSHQLEKLTQSVDWLNKRLLQTHPQYQIKKQYEQLEQLKKRLFLSFTVAIGCYHHKLQTLIVKLNQHHPAHRFKQINLTLQHLTTRLITSIKQQIIHKQAALHTLIRTLHTISPLATLDRGYAIIKEVNTQKIIRDKSQVTPGTHVLATLNNFEIECTVNKVISDL